MEPEPEYGLVMPFVVCASQGGPYDDGAFVAGFTAGRLDAQLQAIAGTPATVQVTVDPRLLPQLDLIAMHHGLMLTSEPWDEHPDEWAFATIGPAPSTEETNDGD